MASDGTQLSFTSSTESFVITSLECCSSYSYQVTARTSAGQGASSPLFGFMTYGQNEGKTWNNEI